MSGESPLAGETRNFSQNAVTCGLELGNLDRLRNTMHACKCTLCCPGCSNTTKLKMTNLKISKATPVVYASPPLSGEWV